MAVTQTELLSQLCPSASTCHFQCRGSASSHLQSKPSLSSSLDSTRRRSLCWTNSSLSTTTHTLQSFLRRSSVNNKFGVPSASINMKNTQMEQNNSINSKFIVNENNKQRSKSMGSFAAAFFNSRLQGADFQNNNHNNVVNHELNTTVNEYTTHRVPVNGEPGICLDTQASGNKNDLVETRRKDNPHFYFNAIPKYNNSIIGEDLWKDDSLSTCSSFSSSISSLPSISSPPSPESPSSSSPSSFLQCKKLPYLAAEGQSSSLPATSFMATYCTSSSGTARRRVKDGEGFIRRAACVCVNQAEDQVLLVSSKNASDLWLVPGGGLEEGEEASQAALREAWEEAGVKGVIVGYLGLFESRQEGGDKKHRTAVYIVRVTREEEEFPESTLIGRRRKWHSVDDALLQLSRHKPRQSVYLQLLRATRLSGHACDRSHVQALQQQLGAAPAAGQPLNIVQGVHQPLVATQVIQEQL